MKCVVGPALALALGWSAAAMAQAKNPAPTTILLSEVQAAQLLIANNRLDDAKRLLDHLLAAKADDSELLFLRANVAVAQLYQRTGRPADASGCASPKQNGCGWSWHAPFS